jgi:hypothetical protein
MLLHLLLNPTATPHLQRQVEVLEAFRSGQVVALLATSVAEEGLDLQSCQLVLRYYLPPNVRSYVQSRGRARCIHSRMVLLLPKGDLKAAARVAALKECASFFPAPCTTLHQHSGCHHRPDLSLVCLVPPLLGGPNM